MLNQKKLNTKIMTRLIPTNMFTVERHTIPSVAITANNYVASTYNITKAGYYPLAVVGYVVGWVSGDTGKCNIYGLYLKNKSDGSGTIDYSLYNPTTTSMSLNLNVEVLWVKE